MDDANPIDRERAGIFERREKDWRVGAVVYQVLVDRFAPSADLEAKRALYPAPKKLRRWDETPARGEYLEAQRIWSHEIDFWGGDIASTAARLDHVQALGADVLYLNPIHLAYTNHKYDALDHLRVSPEFGSRGDVQALAAELHRRGMKLVLDGVFNHMGRHAEVFRRAAADPASPMRDWFVFGDEFAGGARSWRCAENLPELALENPAVREHLYGGRDSVLRSWLREAADGWRLDVASELGFTILDQITRAAHDEKPGSLVVGEIASYPKEWFPALDGVMLFTLRGLILRFADGRLDGASFGSMVRRMVAETGIENMLKSWLHLGNHDTPRLATSLPDERARRLAQVLQFTLPGSPNLYYGDELDMAGGDDPAMRAPMRWDAVAVGHPALAWTKQLVGLRRRKRALRVGNYRPLSTSRLFGFERYTDRAADTVIVLANPGPHDVGEVVMVANSKLMDGTRLVDLLGGAGATVDAALIDAMLPAQSVLVLEPELEPPGGWSSCKRVQ